VTGGFDLDLINKAPIAPIQGEGQSELSELHNDTILLQDGEDHVKKEIAVESQKARVMSPYANKVFVVCCIYAAIAFSILFLHGWTAIPFKLDVSTMNFIPGSNLASVIVLLVIIASGLFTSK